MDVKIVSTEESGSNSFSVGGTKVETIGIYTYCCTTCPNYWRCEHVQAVEQYVIYLMDKHYKKIGKAKL